MLTYNDIKPMLDEGKTPAEIAATFQATGVTKQPVNRAELMHLLNTRNMLRKLIKQSSTQKWTGTVLAMQEAIEASGDEVATDSITLWLSHITNPTNEKWDTTLPEFAAGFRVMVQTFAGLPGMPSQADFDAVLELGGGYAYEDVTAEFVQQLIDDYEVANQVAVRRQIIQTAQTTEQARYEEAIEPPRTRFNNATVALSIFDVENATEAETQAYAVKILASEDGRDPDAPAPEEVI